MIKKLFPLLLPILLAIVLNYSGETKNVLSYKDSNEQVVIENEYWLLLKRKSNIEILYHGEPGNSEKSKIIKTFIVKTGVPNERPTPLPQLLGREYWLITETFDIKNDNNIGPYFLKLDIPYSESAPYGPEPYEECNGQCNWVLPGSFGLHGVAGDNYKLSKENEGSSGCIRHSDKDITYLYHLLDALEYSVRYYIDEN